MSNTAIQLKKSGATGNTPAGLSFGEVAINYADGKLYYKNDSGGTSYISNQRSFDTINSNNSLILATGVSDTLSFVAGNDINITTNTSTKTITINSTANASGGGSTTDTYARSTANAAFLQANAAFAAANSGSGSLVITNDVFTANGSSNTFALSVTPENANNVIVNIDGVIQLKNAYNVANSIVTTSGTPASNAVIGITTLSLVGGSSGSLVITNDVFTANGSSNTFALSVTPENANNVIVNINGVIQLISSFNVANSIVTTSGTPASNAVIGITTLSLVGGSSSSDTYARSTANAAFLQANAAFAAANSGSGATAASSYANSAFLQANAAFSLANSLSGGTSTDGIARDFANSAGSYANSAFLKANSAYNSQNTSGLYANAAFNVANNALDVGGTASSYANAAFSQANAAFAIANSEFNAAGASSYANSAFLKANSAYGSQNTTGTYANSAYTAANTADGKAVTAGTYANAAYTQANSNFTSAVTKLVVTTPGMYYNVDQYSGSNPTVYISAGETIAFLLDNITGHPFMLRVSAGGANYNTGLTHVSTVGVVSTGSVAQSQTTGTVYWKVPFDLAGLTYVYQCSVHSGMVGNIVIQQPVSFVASNTTFAITQADAGFLKANSAYESQNTTGSYANSAYGVANSSSSYANAAFIQANAAFAAANSGSGATAASSYANAAFIQANAAFAAANTGGSSADAYARGTANAAFLRANAAYELANSGSGSLVITNDVFTANGSSNTFTLSVTPASANNIIVNIDGVMQLISSFNVASSIVTTTGTPASNAKIDVTTITGTVSVKYDSFTANGVSNTFALSVTPENANNVIVNIDGVIQLKNAYNVITNTIVTSAVPTSNAKIDVITISTVSGTLTIVNDTFVANGASNTFTLSTTPVDANNVIVNINGILQLHTAYNVVSSVVTTTGTPASNAVIDITTLSLVGGSASSDTYARNTANAAFLKANSAYDSQNTTGSYANSAYTAANTADGKAVTAGSYANAAYTQANTATTNAATADGKAVTSGSYANSAYGVANSAALYANGAFLQANGAYNSQNTTGTYANAAFAFANSAGSYANAAFTVANNALPKTGGTITGSLTVSTDLVVQGNLSVFGNSTTITTSQLEIGDSLILLANNNYTSDAVDIGIVGHYNNAGNAHTGIIRDPNIKEWIFFQGYTPEVQSNNLINIAHPSFAYSNVYGNVFKGNLISNYAIVNGYDVITYTTNAYTQANTATNNAAGASLYANAAFLKANSAYESQNTTGAYANAAYTQANTATTNAATADGKAVTAGSYANSAYTAANTADGKAITSGTYANSAYTQANTATTNAATADGKAVTSGSYANSAYGVANSAALYANAAFIQANAAFTAANTGSSDAYARNTANAAFIQANAAFAQANTGGGGTPTANTAIIDDIYIGDGSTTQFTLSSNVYANSIIVAINGIMQSNVAYTVVGSNNIITLSEAPALNDYILVKKFTGAGGSVSTSGGVTTGKSIAMAIVFGG